MFSFPVVPPLRFEMRLRASLFVLLPVLFAGLIIPTQVAAQRPGLARVTSLAVLVLDGDPLGGDYTTLTCKATPGDGKISLNNKVTDDDSGRRMVESFRSGVLSLKGTGPFSADHRKFDLDFEFEDRTFERGGASAGVAAAVAAFSAMTGKRLRSNIALTGDIGLDGRIRSIAGLEWKVPAAIEANAELMVVPAANDDDVDRLPLLLRLEMPIFGVQKVEQAILACLSPSEPSAKQFADYFLWRGGAMNEFANLFEQHVMSGGSADDQRIKWTPEQDLFYETYFGTNPKAGPALFSEMHQSLIRYPWDSGLKAIFRIGRSIRMTLAAEEEAKIGDRETKKNNIKEALFHYQLAYQLRPIRTDYLIKLSKAVEATLDTSYKAKIELADQLYKEGKFVEAGSHYHTLVTASRPYPSRFPALSRICTARALAARSPTNRQLRRDACALAVKEGFWEDAVSEYRTLIEVEPTRTNVQSLFDSQIQVLKRSEPEKAGDVLKEATQIADKIAGQVGGKEAAMPHEVLGMLLRKEGKLEPAVGELEKAANLEKTPAHLTRLAETYALHAKTLKDQPRAQRFAQAKEVLTRLPKSAMTDEVVYTTLEAVETELKVDETPPLIKLSVQSSESYGKGVAGMLQFSLYTRDLSLVTQMELWVGGKKITQMDNMDVRQGVVNLGQWDSTKHINGNYRVDIRAQDAKGNKAASSVMVLVQNPRQWDQGDVWGDTQTKFYHLPTCKKAPAMVYRAIFPTPTRAENIGFKACFRCIHE